MKSPVFSIALLLVVAASVRAAPSIIPATTDLAGHPVNPLDDRHSKAIVLVFVATDCPICNRYIPTLNHLADDFRGRDVAFFAVYSNRSATPDEIRKSQRDFKLSWPALLDPGAALARSVGAETTPEIAIATSSRDGSRPWIYRGRIDDTYETLGQQRPAPTVHDAHDALAAVLAGHAPKATRTKAVGCYLDP